ncbi:hypothetical protein [Bradyrhizobium sp. NAS80.1]|uniref:hypothetical protein n=1 Tax=Bradyrhizobium sp. NAS80.1 TaxID=1680159 RepID=UPI001160E42E|nr:hypothetical protein [Bradyrhizobium sp. NAS80.1]
MHVLAALLLAWATVAAAAQTLTARDADWVVGLLEALKPDLGRLAYDEEIADAWFEQDGDHRGLIAKAGFTKATWKAALDATMKGFLASIPEPEIEARLGKLRKRANDDRKLNADQKRALLDFIEEQAAQLRAWREQGKSSLAIVRPLAPRLNDLVAGQQDE